MRRLRLHRPFAFDLPFLSLTTSHTSTFISSQTDIYPLQSLSTRKRRLFTDRSIQKFPKTADRDARPGSAHIRSPHHINTCNLTLLANTQHVEICPTNRSTTIISGATRGRLWRPINRSALRSRSARNEQLLWQSGTTTAVRCSRSIPARTVSTRSSTTRRLLRRPSSATANVLPATTTADVWSSAGWSKRW